MPLNFEITAIKIVNLSEIFWAQMQDITLGVALGSATQISMFVVRINLKLKLDASIYKAFLMDF